jgi:hypothetical protein
MPTGIHRYTQVYTGIHLVYTQAKSVQMSNVSVLVGKHNTLGNSPRVLFVIMLASVPRPSNSLPYLTPSFIFSLQFLFTPLLDAFYLFTPLLDAFYHVTVNSICVIQFPLLTNPSTNKQYTSLGLHLLFNMNAV